MSAMKPGCRAVVWIRRKAEPSECETWWTANELSVGSVAVTTAASSAAHAGSTERTSNQTPTTDSSAQTGLTQRPVAAPNSHVIRADTKG